MTAAAAAAVAPPRPVPAVAGAAANLRRRRRDGFCSLKRGWPLRRSRACATRPRHYPPPDPRFCRRTIVHLWDAHAALKPGGRAGRGYRWSAQKEERGTEGRVGWGPSVVAVTVGVVAARAQGPLWWSPATGGVEVSAGLPKCDRARNASVFFLLFASRVLEADTVCVPARNLESGTCARRQRQEVPARKTKERRWVYVRRVLRAERWGGDLVDRRERGRAGVAEGIWEQKTTRVGSESGRAGCAGAVWGGVRGGAGKRELWPPPAAAGAMPGRQERPSRGGSVALSFYGLAAF